MTTFDKGAAIVVQPDEGESYWQPVPANGYAEVRVSSRDDPSINRFSSGIQVIAPGGRVREHQHGANEELLFFFEGRGRVVIDGVEHPLRPGTTVYVGPWRKHTFINDGESDLKMCWVLVPGGLEDFFQAIGRSRTPGEPTPAPFPRPEDVEQIEAGTVFAHLSEGPLAERNP